MNLQVISGGEPELFLRRVNVSLSPWINEAFPGWTELLSAHDVARLTRRPRWVLVGMAALGRFPAKHRFRGRGIGWLRRDVIEWMDLRTLGCRAATDASRFRRGFRRQMSLPFGGDSGACHGPGTRGPCLPHLVRRR